MDPDVLRDVLRRLDELERTAVRYRAGEVTGVNPLDVALGGAGTSYEDVKSLLLAASGDAVAALVWGNDLIVLGEIGDGTVHYIGSGDGVAPAFTNSWVNFDGSSTTPVGGTSRDAGFYKAGGRVYLTGLIKTGSSATSAFTLPVGYRPKVSFVERAVVASGGIANVQVAAAGTVTPVNVGASAVASNVYLEGVSFIAA